LRWQRGNYVRERVIRQPRRAVIVGLARPHPVARDSWVTTRAAGALARIIPRRKESAGRTNRQIRLPLRTCRGIGVQLQRRAKGHTTVGRTDVINVAWVSAGAVLGIDQVNNIVECCRLTPALVPPVAAAVRKHAGEVTYSCNARSGEGSGARVSVSPGVAAVG
jgi:hypothetical protein